MVYAELPTVRSRQLLTDVLVVAWTAGWVLVGVLLHRAIGRLAAPGRALADAGRDLAGAASGGGDRVSDVPLVGDALAAPFESVAAGGSRLVDAGTTGQEVVGWLAVWPVLLLVGTPVVLVLVVHLWRRVRWAREAAAVARLRDADGAVALLALRALTSRRVRDLTRAAADPHAAYAAGDHQRLAALELRTLGLRPPSPR